MSVKPEKVIENDLTNVKGNLECVVQFLNNYDSILSQNLVGFLTKNLWQHIPLPIQSELMTLSNDVLCILPASENNFTDDIGKNLFVQ